MVVPEVPSPQIQPNERGCARYGLMGENLILLEAAVARLHHDLIGCAKKGKKIKCFMRRRNYGAAAKLPQRTQSPLSVR